MTSKMMFPKWLVSVSDWLDANVFTNPAAKREADLLAYDRRITNAAYEVNRVAKSCTRLAHTYVAIDMLTAFTKLYGHTAIGKHAALGILKEIRAIEAAILKMISQYQTYTPTRNN